MALKTILERIASFRYLEVPKALYSDEAVTFVYGDIRGETDACWLVDCSQVLGPPAKTEEIESIEKQLGLPVPEQYKEFLRIADGAKLFAVSTPWLEPEFPDAVHVRHSIFGCRELVLANRELASTFRGFYANDPEYEKCQQVNYIAFCDADDGNYQAMLLEPPSDRRIFLLFHELFYRPYTDADSEFCYTIANSLEGWLELILRTGGWGGRGALTSGL